MSHYALTALANSLPATVPFCGARNPREGLGPGLRGQVGGQ